MIAVTAVPRARRCLVLLLGLVAALPLPAAAAEPADLGIEWVTVGNPGNAPDPATGRGGVAGVFQISKHEVTVGQYAAFLGAVAANDPHGLWTGGLPIARTGGPGAFTYAAKPGHERMPVVNLTFLDCMRFANWLHHLQSDPAARGPAKSPADAARLTETGAYSIAAGGGLAARQPGAQAWIPNEDEWYKAAYHQPRLSGGPPSHYWRFPTRSDAIPALGKPGDTGANLANFLADATDQPNGGVLRGYEHMMPVGSFPGAASHYGTLDQAGNVWEWIETTVFDTQRVIRGGSMCATYEKLLPRVRTSASPSRRYPDTGFRIARAVPPEASPAPEVKPAPEAKPTPEAKP
ncbi:MAG: formylglycine-generating enzyme family protein [Planctomycetia bacterium]